MLASQYTFLKYVPYNDYLEDVEIDPSIVASRIPVHMVSDALQVAKLREIARDHGIDFYAREVKDVIVSLLSKHSCQKCYDSVCVFVPHMKKEELKKENELLHAIGQTPVFPPDPPSNDLIKSIILDWCRDSSPHMLEEDGCAVCGQLSPLQSLTALKDMPDLDLSCLKSPDSTRMQRHSIKDKVMGLKGPVMDSNCSSVCPTCLKSLKGGKKPKFALANGLWLGDVPPQLKNLTFAEQMLISRVRHNRCLIRVASGRAKMIANAIMFATPVVKVYHTLPPSLEEASEVIAVIFMGANQPTDEQFKRTPMLVRRNKISAALEWLKLNHKDYEDLTISKENLEQYPLSGVPVVVDFRKVDSEIDPTDKLQSEMSKHETVTNVATKAGPCPLVVHGITGSELTKLSLKALKIKALAHMEDGGKALGVGQDADPTSMYNNPQLYPQMFPWLFPYGYGGIGQPRHAKFMSESLHKRFLLMYHDKRFQTDFYFPMIAFNHEQIKGNVTGSFLMARREKFKSITERIVSLDKEVLKDISTRLSKGELFKPETDEEKKCFALLEDVDHVGSKTQGSLTCKKYMRNEIWSLISWKGAPSWFITLSPVDSRHPICLYYAGSDKFFQPDILTSKDRDALVLKNPVAAARFFHHIVQMFLKHVLGVGKDGRGLYGETSAYYGTVEQQGRLTLHLHIMIWIANAMSPQDIRDKLMDKDSAFQKSLVEYLEKCHQGDFTTGMRSDIRELVRDTMLKEGRSEEEIEADEELRALEEVKEDLKNDQSQDNQSLHTDRKHKKNHKTTSVKLSATQLHIKIEDTTQQECIKQEPSNEDARLARILESDPCYELEADPTLTMPQMPPPTGECKCKCDQCLGISDCVECQKDRSWWCYFYKTVDIILYKSNIHTCRIQRSTTSSTNKPASSQPKGCLDRNGCCKARFPRDLYEKTVIEDDGHIDMKKREPMVNTFSLLLSYLCRGNTDVSSLMSGTAVKAIVSYVTDYITKPSLKSHQIFTAAYDIYQKNADSLIGENSRADAARKILMKMANSLTAKLEVGSPMACMYLLGNPDHYTSHEFITFWWKSFVSHITRQEFGSDEAEDTSTTDNVLITRSNGEYLAWCNIDDYVFRPEIYKDVNVTEWVQCSIKKKMYKPRKKGQ
ncbi:hypothetical protein NMY22_g12852 [Coprinellus aureogranulatus]|nr:hypothetical protein NMY22_g12852 [Coprinellus aureogranulatus]